MWFLGSLTVRRHDDGQLGACGRVPAEVAEQLAQVDPAAVAVGAAQLDGLAQLVQPRAERQVGDGGQRGPIGLGRRRVARGRRGSHGAGVDGVQLQGAQVGVGVHGVVLGSVPMSRPALLAAGNRHDRRGPRGVTLVGDTWEVPPRRACRISASTRNLAVSGRISAIYVRRSPRNARSPAGRNVLRGFAVGDSPLCGGRGGT